jgi:hypothetical protein
VGEHQGAAVRAGQSERHSISLSSLLFSFLSSPLSSPLSTLVTPLSSLLPLSLRALGFTVPHRLSRGTWHSPLAICRRRAASVHRPQIRTNTNILSPSLSSLSEALSFSLSQSLTHTNTNTRIRLSVSGRGDPIGVIP